MYIIVIAMLFISCIGFFNETANFFFAGGSDFLMTTIATNSWVQIFLVLIFTLTLFKSKTKSRIKFYFRILVFIIWLMSGRTIYVFPNGKIGLGWFFVETNRFYICSEGDKNCDDTVTECKISEKALFLVKIQTIDKENVFYVGPFIYGKTIHSLNSIFH